MAGASGYVLKQISSGDLVTAVRRVAAGQSMLDPAVTPGCCTGCGTGSDGTRLTQHLTAREAQILELVAEGLTNRQIARAPRRGREDGEELRVDAARQARCREPDAGGGDGGPPSGHWRRPSGTPGPVASLLRVPLAA